MASLWRIFNRGGIFFSTLEIAGLQHCWLMIYSSLQSGEKPTALLGSACIPVSPHQQSNYWSASAWYLHLISLSSQSCYWLSSCCGPTLFKHQYTLNTSTCDVPQWFSFYHVLKHLWTAILMLPLHYNTAAAVLLTPFMHSAMSPLCMRNFYSLFALITERDIAPTMPP